MTTLLYATKGAFNSPTLCRKYVVNASRYQIYHQYNSQIFNINLLMRVG